MTKTYTISLTLGNTTHKGKGETILEALESMMKPVKIITKGLLRVSDGVKTYEQSLPPPRIKRLFYPQAQFYQARYLSLMLK
jgi:hypothetical protein